LEVKKVKVVRLYRILNEVRELPDYLYHVTAKQNLPYIKKNGLEPKQSESSSDGVYLSDGEFTAANYANMRPSVDHILLKIDTSYLDEESLFPDDYELVDFLKRNGWEVGEKRYYSVEDVNWKESLKYVNQIVYKDVIPYGAIKIKKSKFLP